MLWRSSSGRNAATSRTRARTTRRIRRFWGHSQERLRSRKATYGTAEAVPFRGREKTISALLTLEAILDLLGQFLDLVRLFDERQRERGTQVRLGDMVFEVGGH